MKIKKRIFNWLIWLLRKIDQMQFERCSIGTEIKADFTQYVPDDGGWHYCAMTVEYWLKVDRSKIEKNELFMDGVRVSSTLREIPTKEQLAQEGDHHEL